MISDIFQRKELKFCSSQHLWASPFEYAIGLFFIYQYKAMSGDLDQGNYLCKLM